MKNPQDNQPFFTAGVGVVSEDQNTFEAENNLDLSSAGTASWMPDRDPRSLGNKAIFSTNTEIPTPSLEEEPKTEQKPEDLTPPPMFPTPDMATVPAPEPVPEFDSKAIRTEGDHVNHAALVEIERIVSKLNKTGDVASFYAAVRGDENTPGMVRDNLKNSFGREVG